MKLFIIYSIILILFQLTNFSQSNENKQNNEKNIIVIENIWRHQNE